MQVSFVNPSQSMNAPPSTKLLTESWHQSTDRLNQAVFGTTESPHASRAVSRATSSNAIEVKVSLERNVGNGTKVQLFATVGQKMAWVPTLVASDITYKNAQTGYAITQATSAYHGSEAYLERLDTLLATDCCCCAETTLPAGELTESVRDVKDLLQDVRRHGVYYSETATGDRLGSMLTGHGILVLPCKEMAETVREGELPLTFGDAVAMDLHPDSEYMRRLGAGDTGASSPDRNRRREFVDLAEKVRSGLLNARSLPLSTTGVHVVVSNGMKTMGTPGDVMQPAYNGIPRSEMKDAERYRHTVRYLQALFRGSTNYAHLPVDELEGPDSATARKRVEEIARWNSVKYCGMAVARAAEVIRDLHGMDESSIKPGSRIFSALSKSMKENCYLPRVAGYGQLEMGYQDAQTRCRAQATLAHYIPLDPLLTETEKSVSDLCVHRGSNPYVAPGRRHRKWSAPTSDWRMASSGPPRGGAWSSAKKPAAKRGSKEKSKTMTLDPTRA